MAGETDRCDFYWQSPRYQDLRFAATGINPIGAARDPTVETDLDGVPGALLFSPTTENIVSVLVQLPHGRQRSAGMHPHIHYQRATAGAGAIVWQARHRLIGNVAGAMQAWTAWETLVDTVPDPVPDVHLLANYSYITDADLADSAMFCFMLRRLATDPADTYAGNARLLELDWHIRLIAAGSEAEIPT